MAGSLKPNIPSLGKEVTARNISGAGNYSTSPLALFDGITSGGSYAYGIMYWLNKTEYIQFTIDYQTNIWRTPSPNYLPYQTGKLLLYQYINNVWVDITKLYPQKNTTLANGQWQIFISDLPAGTYKFTGDGSTILIDSEWYLESAQFKCLVKQFNLYYSVKPEYYDSASKSLIPLTLSGGNVPNSQDIKTFGFDGPQKLLQDLTIENETFKPIDKLSNKFDIKMYRPK